MCTMDKKTDVKGTKDAKAGKVSYEVVKSEELSRTYEERYIIIDKETNEVLDDAQGYGYKSKQKAHAAYAYKNRDRSKDSEKTKKKSEVKNWCKRNKSFVQYLETIQLEIAMGKWGKDDKFDAKLIKQMFKEEGFTDLSFTIAEFLRYWRS